MVDKSQEIEAAWNLYQQRKTNAEKQIKLLDNAIYWYETGGLISIASGVAALIFGFYYYTKPHSEALLGQFGDFIGGLAGILFALAGFLYLVATLNGQQKQFVYVHVQQAYNDWATQNAIYQTFRQSREQMFFVLMENLRGTVNRLSIPSVLGDSVSGLSCLSILLKRLDEAKSRLALAGDKKAVEQYLLDFGGILKGYFEQTEKVADFIQATGDTTLQQQFKQLLSAQLTKEEKRILLELPNSQAPQIAKYLRDDEIIRQS